MLQDTTRSFDVLFNAELKPNRRNFPKFQVHLFVCNEDRDIETALRLGATGVMTDYPTRLTDYLSRLTWQGS